MVLPDPVRDGGGEEESEHDGEEVLHQHDLDPHPQVGPGLLRVAQNERQEEAEAERLEKIFRNINGNGGACK